MVALIAVDLGENFIGNDDKFFFLPERPQDKDYFEQNLPELVREMNKFPQVQIDYVNGIGTLKGKSTQLPSELEKITGLNMAVTGSEINLTLNLLSGVQVIMSNSDDNLPSVVLVLNDGDRGSLSFSQKNAVSSSLSSDGQEAYTASVMFAQDIDKLGGNDFYFVVNGIFGKPQFIPVRFNLTFPPYGKPA